MENEFSLGKWLSTNNFRLLPIETKLLNEGYENFDEDERSKLIELVSEELKIESGSVDDSTLLRFCKILKIKKLKKDCTTAIHQGFTSTVGDGETMYEFGLNEHDQGNFNSQINKMNLRMNLLIRGLITQEEYDLAMDIYWKSKNIGIVGLNEMQFIQVTDDAEFHIRSLQGKYWVLEDQVLNATNCEELKLITWEEKETEEDAGLQDSTG